MQDFFSTHVLPEFMSWDSHKQAESQEFGIRKWQKQNKWENKKQTISKCTHWATWSIEHSNMPYGQWGRLRTQQQITWKEFVYSEWPCSRVSNFDRITETSLNLTFEVNQVANPTITVYAVNYDMQFA